MTGNPVKTSANQCLSPLLLPWTRRRIPKTHRRPLLPLEIGSSPLERGQHRLDWIITAGFIAIPVFLVYRQVSRITTAYSGEFVPYGTPLGIPWNWAASPHIKQTLKMNSIVNHMAKYDHRQHVLSDWLAELEQRFQIGEVTTHRAKITWCQLLIGATGSSILASLEDEATWETAKETSLGRWLCQR